MRLAGTISNEDQARQFYGYLLTLGIPSKVEPGDGGFAVWIRDEEHVEKAAKELAEFLRQPDDTRYANALENARQILRDEVAKDRKARKNYVDLRDQWGCGAPRRPPLTLGIIAIAATVTFCSDFGDTASSLAQDLSICTYVKAGKVVTPSLAEVVHGQVWRLVTPIFIHLNGMHLLFNMWMLFDLGQILESRRGRVWLALIVVAVAIPSNLAQYAYDGPAFGGMSGVLYGLFGYLWMKDKFDPAAGIRLNPRFIVLMVGWFFLCMAGVMGPIANMAHAVGMVTGIVIGLAPLGWRRLRG